MKTALRVAVLFAVYGTIGYGGDYAAGLLAQDSYAYEQEWQLDPEVQVDVDVDAEPVVVVDVRPEVVVDVRVRHSGACEYAETLSMVVSPEQYGSGLHVDAGAGELKVASHTDGDDIRVSAELCASVEEWLEDLRVTADRLGDGIVISAHYPQSRDRSFGNSTARIDLEISVPQGLDVSIDDSSGDIEVSGTGDLRVEDSSGSIDVYSILGSVSIDDSSGDLRIRDVQGDVSVDDGSGGLSISGVLGSVAVRDGSGGIDVRDVARDVRILEDGSGSIDVRSIAGDFTVDEMGSGSVRYTDVAGQVTVPEDCRRRRRRPCR